MCSTYLLTYCLPSSRVVSSSSSSTMPTRSSRGSSTVSSSSKRTPSARHNPSARYTPPHVACACTLLSPLRPPHTPSACACTLPFSPLPPSPLPTALTAPHTRHVPSRPVRYAEEGIPPLSLDTAGLDNAPCRRLLEGGAHQGSSSPPKGLLSLLEEECQVLYLLYSYDDGDAYCDDTYRGCTYYARCPRGRTAVCSTSSSS